MRFAPTHIPFWIRDALVPVWPPIGPSSTPSPTSAAPYHQIGRYPLSGSLKPLDPAGFFAFTQ